jgi:sarcosine oxidase subunit gamma
MNTASLQVLQARAQLGCKGPRAAEWLAAQGLAVPTAPNTYLAAAAPADGADGLLAARLGASEFFLEQSAGGQSLRRVALALGEPCAGVYPVLREDWALTLAGTGALGVLAQVCNVNFAALDMDRNPLVMTLIIGVAVLVVPQAEAAERCYRIWCDPTYGPYLSETLGGVVVECGGSYRGMTA